MNQKKNNTQEASVVHHYPTTPEEANFYEYLRHAHCHRCLDGIDCDVEDFLSCEVPKELAVSWDKNAKRKFSKCSCFQCIEDKKLQQILQGYYRRVKKLYKIKEEPPKKKEAKKKAEVKKKGPAEAPLKKKSAKVAPKRETIQQSLFGIRKKAS